MRPHIRLAALGLIGLGLLVAAPQASRGDCDPVECAQLLASDAAAGDNFGNAVAVSGSTAVIAAVYDDHAGGTDAGSAYVFVRSGGTWIEQAKLTAADAAAFDYFGSSVCISGDTVVIGASRDDPGGAPGAGSAYVFVRSGGLWTQQAKLTASDAAPNDYFGRCVSISGETVVIGADRADHAGGIDAGAAYVFVRSGAIWTQQAKLTSFDAAPGDYFGHSVSVSGDTAIIGAYCDDQWSWTNAGSAYVFVRSGGNWTQQSRLTAPDAAAYDQFGFSVCLFGETALIGAYADDHAGGADAGSAYVFVRSGTSWTQQAKLTASNAAAGDSFGYSVSLTGDTAVIGAYTDDHAGGTDAGSAYVFVRSGTSWAQQANLAASDAAPGDRFGVSVSASDDWIVIGADLADNAGKSNTGSAYVFDRSCQTLGDLNCDGTVNTADISAFVLALLDPAEYADQYPLCSVGRADMNQDGAVDGRDVQLFVTALVGP